MDATVQSVFRLGFEAYSRSHRLSIDQHKAARAIMECGTEALGHEEWICPEDGHIERQAHSCRHRSCPRCHGAYTHEWLEKAKRRLLPCDHYHVVFTLPHELNDLWRYNRAWSADHLFKAAAETLRELLRDDRYLGGEVGLLVALHTWGRTLVFHPHVHVLVTGGGWAERAWKPLEKGFLLPVGVVKAKFRGKWLAWLNDAYGRGALRLPAGWSEGDWRRILRKVARKSWNVRIEGPYRHGEGVLNYLSRYIHGGPIKDSRVVAADGEGVVFNYRNHRDGKSKCMRLGMQTFIGRILSHVPVKGQHNVRYYGLYVPKAVAKRELICQALGERNAVSPLPQKASRSERCCPNCGSALLHWLSRRREISYKRNTGAVSARDRIVQQAVGADADPWPRYYFAPSPRGST